MVDLLQTAAALAVAGAAGLVGPGAPAPQPSRIWSRSADDAGDHPRLSVRRGCVLVVVVAGVLAVLVRSGAVASERVPLLAGWVTAGGLVVGGVAALARRGARSGRDRAARARVLRAVEAMVVDLEAGAPAGTALAEAVVVCPELQEAATAASLGTDVPTALRRVSQGPGLADLRLVAAVWAVAHRTGGGLGTALRSAAVSLRSRAGTRRVVVAELASARATARLMAVLPVGTWLLGVGSGADPLGFLLGSGVGLLCLVAGVALTLAGVAWIETLAHGVESEL